MTKRFKDDVVPQASNQTSEEADEAEEGDEVQEGSSEQEERADAAGASKGEAAASDLAFVAKFKLNRRTLADLCNQIETDEQKK